MSRRQRPPKPPAIRPRLFASSLWLLIPIVLLYGGCALVPFGIILRTSLAGGGTHFAAVLDSPLLRHAAINTLVISLITTGVTLVLGTILAAALWRAPPRIRPVLLAFILLPFWTAVLIKNFAWAALLQDNGLVNTGLLWLGLTDRPMTLLHNRTAVIIGMVHYLLPYAVFPIYAAMDAIDPQLERAARSLGAPARRTLWSVILPLTLPGLTSAALLVFVVSIGFFITPVILGAPSDMMIANLVDYYIHELVDFGAAAALAVLVVAAIVPLVILQQSLPKAGQHGAT